MLFLVNACDHLTKAISIASIAAKLSKNAAAFVSANGSVTEIGNGFYKLTMTATDTNTLGDLAFHITDATGKADDTDFIDQVIALNIANATFPTNFSALSIDTSGRVDNGKWMGSSLASCNVAGVPRMDLARWLGSIPNPLIGARVDATATLASGVPTNFSALSISATGGVNATVPGYVNASIPAIVNASIAQAFPSNFSAMAITAGGAVTAGTVSDKTGYSLAAGGLFIKKNTALANFLFMMIDSTDHVTPKTGLTVTGQVVIDGAAIASLTNAVSEVSNGIYKVNLAAADTNGTSLMLRFTATGADARLIPIITQT